MLRGSRIEKFLMSRCCVLTNIFWNKQFDYNLKVLGSASYICSITAILKFINQVAFWEDREHILMNRAKRSLSSKDGLNHSRIITEEGTLLAINWLGDPIKGSET